MRNLEKMSKRELIEIIHTLIDVIDKLTIVLENQTKKVTKK